MKKRIAVIFGGQSSEHEVSCMSVQNIAGNIDTERYELVLVGITKEGRWLLVDKLSDIADGSWTKSETGALLLPDASLQALLLCYADGTTALCHIDVIFPALHGKLGEDGTIQGLFELAQIPYVGCGVLASAVSMDKLYTKLLVDAPLRALGVRQAMYVSLVDGELSDELRCAEKVEASLSYPVFVKPSSAGSSCGVSKAENRDMLLAAIREAARFDRKVLVEETIVGREIESAVFRGGDGVIKVSGLGEIEAAAAFYDYDAKYNNPESRTNTAPALDEAVREQVRRAAAAVFEAVDGYGLSRVDFFVTKEGPVFNEINTLPGFTAISMYPMLWEAAGVPKKQLIQDLIDTAFARP